MTIILVICLVICIVYILTDKIKQHKLATKLKEKRIIRNNRIKNELIPYFIHQLELAQTLDEIYLLHIKIWANGIRNRNIGPDQYGMFRTDDILLMNKSEVYLGNIWGLNTGSILFWEQHPEELPTVIKQYKNHLISNLNAIKNDNTTNFSNL